MIPSNMNTTVEETLHCIEAMCRQEENGYKTCDYLHQSSAHNNANSSCMPPQNLIVVDIDMDCRTKMAAWCYQVVDFCKFNRETVAIAMNLLDRYMANVACSHAAHASRKLYQLAAMTALYTAVKIHEPEAMDPKLVSTLSRGTYQPHEVEAMEVELLTALTWRVNPPTAMAFVRHYLDLIPEDNNNNNMMLDTVYELAKFQTELAVSEYDFLNVKPSVIGYCALMNALESVGTDPMTLQSIANMLSEAIQAPAVTDIRNWLFQAILQEPAAQDMFARSMVPASSSANNTVPKGTLERESSCEVSPRSIAA